MARCPTCHRRLLTGRGCAQHGGAPAPADAGALGPAPAWTRPLGARIGSGGFAAVWEIAGTPNVLKVAHAGHELARARMRREAEALAAIGAPAAPRLHGSGVLDDGRAWLEMERITGTNLADLIAAGPMPIHLAIELAAGILDALVRVHAARFVHRDLKPDNLVRRPDGTGTARSHITQRTQITQITRITPPSPIVILDLGLARKVPADPDDPTRAGVQVGSLEYMPPEQLLDAGSADERADLYAFGCVLYELCSGRPPFVGDASVLERAHAALRPPQLGALASVPAALEALCHECLAKQPARRPPSAAEVARRLREIPAEPAPGRALPTMSMISEGKQPVVLLWAELPRVDRTLLDMLSSRKLALVSRRGRRVLGGLVGAEHPDPISSALAAARDLAAAGARVALHLDALVVRPSAGGTSLEGAAAEQPEEWLPQGPWTGVVLTRAIAAVSRASVRATELGPAFLKLGEGREATELYGRDAVLAELCVDAADALAGAGPALTVLLGEPGVGKSAVAAALVPRLGALGARVHLASVPPPGSGKPAHAALADLIGTPAGPMVRAVGNALRAAARAAPTALLLDDLHLADHELLDALEYATLGGEPLALWVLGVAAPSLDHRRPGFGARAERRARSALPPLDEPAAIALAEALLRPAAYVPLGALRQIAGIARGNPMHLVTLAREIHDRGAIIARPNGEHFLDTTALDTLPPLALGPWLAVRELAGMGVELVALARLCAVLGGDLSRAEIAAVLEAVERAGGAATTIDVDIGLAELESTGVLVRAGDRWTFRQALLEQGVYETTNEDERRALHTVALAYWRGRPADPAVAARVARHAEAVGERAVAAEAYAALGAHAHQQHRSLDADQAWQGALRNLDPGTVPHARALLGRARARYRLQRQHEARADLEEVIGVARARGEAELEIEAMLELATVLDWSERFDESSAITDQARQRLAALPARPRALEVDVELAAARTVFRRGEPGQAAPRLRAVIAEARELGRWETVTIAGMLLALSLVQTDELDAAEAAFAEMIELCEARDDRFHLAAALSNRVWLWSARGEIRRSDQDTRAVIQLTREGGQAHIERAATYNLAEDLLWQGQLDESLQLARRCLRLQQGHGEGTTSPDLMLIARVLAAMGEHAELAAVLAQIDIASLGAEEQLVHRALVAAAGRAGRATWSELLADSAALPVASRLEIVLLAARGGGLAESRRVEAVALARDNPLFVSRVNELSLIP